MIQLKGEIYKITAVQSSSVGTSENLPFSCHPRSIWTDFLEVVTLKQTVEEWIGASYTGHKGLSTRLRKWAQIRACVVSCGNTHNSSWQENCPGFPVDLWNTYRAVLSSENVLNKCSLREWVNEWKWLSSAVVDSRRFLTATIRRNDSLRCREINYYMKRKQLLNQALLHLPNFPVTLNETPDMTAFVIWLNWACRKW